MSKVGSSPSLALSAHFTFALRFIRRRRKFFSFYDSPTQNRHHQRLEFQLPGQANLSFLKELFFILQASDINFFLGFDWGILTPFQNCEAVIKLLCLRLPRYIDVRQGLRTRFHSGLTSPELDFRIAFIRLQI